MKQLKLLLLSVFCVLTYNSLASGDVKITTGIIQFNQGNYASALEHFNLGLKDISKLKQKNIAKGFLYRGKTHFILAQQELSLKNAESKPNFGEGFILASKDFKQVLKYNSEKDNSTVLKERDRLKTALYNMGVYFGNISLSQNSENGMANRKADNFFREYISIDSTNYMVYDMLGQLNLQSEDSAQGFQNFQKGVYYYHKFSSHVPDIQAVYLFYRLALMERLYKKDLKKSLGKVNEGIAALENEMTETKKHFNEFSKEQISSINSFYLSANGLMSKFQLDLLLNMPEETENALVSFEKSLQKNPRDYSVLIGFGSLLERIDKQRAIEVYEQAIVVDSTEMTAQFNLGALYNNLAVDLLNKNALLNDEKRAINTTNAMDYLRLSYERFKSCNRINPNDLSIIKALQSITLKLELKEEYQKYKDMESEISK